MLYAHDFIVKLAMALFCMSTKKTMQESISTCLFYEVSFFEYGLYMCCVACMIFALDSAIQIAMGLFVISTSKQMQAKYKDVRVCSEVSFFEYGLYMFCVACMMFAYDCVLKMRWLSFSI